MFYHEDKMFISLYKYNYFFNYTQAMSFFFYDPVFEKIVILWS